LRNFVPFLIFFCVCLKAQSPNQSVPGGASPLTLVNRQFEILSRTVQESKEDQARHVTAAREENLARLLFWQKANHFVALWTDFAARLNGQQTFDAKLAKKLSKAFHDLEESEGWPVRGEAKTK
jgi:hypothetical protein